MSKSSLAGGLAHATPFSMIAPTVLTGPLGAPLALEQAALQRSLVEPQNTKVEGLGRVLCLDRVGVVADLVGRLSGLQPPKTDVAINGFGKSPNDDLAQWQSTVLKTCFTAATALALTQQRGEEKLSYDMTQVVRLAFSATPAGIVLRDQLGTWGVQRTKPFDPSPGLPGLPKFALELLVRVEALLKSACGRVAVAALNSWAVAMASNSPRYLNNAIRSLDPSDACPDKVITLHGVGFGDGKRAAVVFSGLGGSSVIVPQADVQSWSDTEIVVVVPKKGRRGPVGVVVFPEPSAVTLADAASKAVGELGQCFGPLAVAEVKQTLGKFTTPVLGTPPPQPNGANLFIGGPPVIRHFDVRPRGALYPQQTIVLDWIVDGADRVEIVARDVAGSAPHELPPIGGRLDPVAGSVGAVIPGSRRWRGEYVLQAFNRCTGATTPTEAVLPLEMALRQGLALGGGGTRGDFQVGALLYLYDNKGFRPEAIAGTSVGAVNAVDLVMGDDPGRNAVQRLRDTWLSLNTDADMWGDEPWLSGLKAKTRLALRSLSIEGLLAAPYAIGALGIAAADIKDLLSNMRARGAVSLFNIDPIEARMRAQFDPVKAAASGIRLRLVAVSVDNGEIVQITETGQVISNALRAPIVPTGAGAAPLPDVIDGAVASSVMPGIFRSRRIGDHNGVDGGVRDVVPVRVAVRDLGCNRVYAVRCSAPPTIEPLDLGRAFPSVMARSVLELTYDEVADNDVEPFNGWGTGVEVFTIQPSFDLHDPMVVEPGLIRIAMDYGWMRAADMIDVQPAIRQSALAMCDEIIQLRVQNWRLAHEANGNRWSDPHRSFTDFLLQGVTPATPPQTVPVPDPAAVTQVRANARSIRVLIARRMSIGAPVPDPSVRNAWFQQWEVFSFGGALLMPDPWGTFSSRLGTLPAESMPAPL
jgi:predicted acylesterase/phospholipase RssA